MLLTHFIWQTDLKPLSGTNAKNGAITPSLTPTRHRIHAICYKASEWVGGEFTVQARYFGLLNQDLVQRKLALVRACIWGRQSRAD